MEDALLQKINKVERIAGLSKIEKLLHAPGKYFKAIFFRKFIYPRNKKELIIEADLFYGQQMTIALPASTDIYLTGGKSHDSEVRLARFIILNLEPGDQFLDIGAHYGYFSLLAAHIVGEGGRVVAFEPAEASYRLLHINIQNRPNVTYYQKAVTDTTDGLFFYEFPNMYSEYNSADVTQFEQEDWFKSARPRRIEVPSTTIDEFVKGEGFRPMLVKIDVEGGEYNVIKGAEQVINNISPIFVMEYLSPERHNDEHRKALQLLRSHGYRSYKILHDGQLEAMENIDEYLIEQKMESDNIVFKKN